MHWVRVTVTTTASVGGGWSVDLTTARARDLTVLMTVAGRVVTGEIVAAARQVRALKVRETVTRTMTVRQG